MKQRGYSKAKKRSQVKLWPWIKSHRISTFSFTSLLTIIAMCVAYVNSGADSLRTEIYQPLFREIGGVELAAHSNNLSTSYSSEVYEALTRNGSLRRIPKALRNQIIRLYETEGVARVLVVPIAHKISFLIPQEVAKIRTEAYDAAWKETTVALLNAEASNDLTQGSFAMSEFKFNHTGIGPSIDIRDKAHLRIASPGTVTWLVQDWIDLPNSTSNVEKIWQNTYFLGLDERDETWKYRITREDLVRSHKTLEEFLFPIYQNLTGDPDFKELLRNNRTAVELGDSVKGSLADRIEQPKRLMDLLDFL